MKPIYRNKLTVVLLAAATLLPTACSENELPVTPPVGGSTVQVELTAQIGAEKVVNRTSAGTLTRVVNNKWELNDMVGIYMCGVDEALSDGNMVSDADGGTYKNKRYRMAEKADKTGLRLVAATQEDAMYYPEGGETVYFTAYYPFSSAITDIYEYPLDIRYQDGNTNYDLLYTNARASGSSAIASEKITFDHQLTKLVVKLKPEQSTLDLSTMMGEVINVPVTGKFSLIDGSITVDVLTGQEKITVLDSYSENSGKNFDGSDYQTGVGSEMVYTCFDIILLPHDAPGNGTDRRLNFSTPTRTYSWKLPDTQAFAANKKYTIILSIEGDVMIPESITINDWDDGEETLSIAMVKIPAAGASFWMGSPDGVTEISYGGDNKFLPDADPMAAEDGREFPIHEVNFTKDFYMSKYEITAEQFCKFLNAHWEVITKDTYAIEMALSGTDAFGQDKNYGVVCLGQYRNHFSYNTEKKWYISSGEGNDPVTMISWYGALAFAEWVGGRLPTEAEWEYACRGGDYFYGTAAYRWASFNEAALGDYAWDKANTSEKHVGSLKRANGFGLHDMHGNLREWCYDWYDAAFYSKDAATATDPVNTTAVSTHRVLRGGSYSHDAAACRSACRNSDDRYDGNIGFRVVFPL